MLWQLAEFSNALSLLYCRLPRRESERRNHPLIRHCDVLTAIETRISLLQMTFMKYVDAEACCFIPGKVIDELFEVLRKISATDAEIPRSYEVLQAGLLRNGALALGFCFILHFKFHLQI